MDSQETQGPVKVTCGTNISAVAQQKYLPGPDGVRAPRPLLSRDQVGRVPGLRLHTAPQQEAGRAGDRWVGTEVDFTVELSTNK